MQQYNCQNGQSWYDVCLNTYGSLDYLGKLVSDNGGELNIQPTTNTVIYWDQSLVKDSSLLSLIKNNGYVYNTGVQIPFPYIQSYTAGTSTIDFTNNGGDDWDIEFKIAMTSPQLPSGCTAPNYDVNVYFYLSGTGTAIDTNTGVTIDKTVNASGNGAGVYVAQQVYNILDSNLSNAGIIAISSLFKVNASGTLLAYFKCNGVTVNSVNGLYINVTADVTQSENYPIEWYSYDSLFNPTLIGTGLTANLTLPTDCAYLIAQPILDSVFTVDFPNQSTNISTVTIN